MSIQRVVLACQHTTESKHHDTHTIYSLLCRARRSCLYREWFLPANTQQSLNIMTLIQYTACYVEPGGRVYIESGSCLPHTTESKHHDTHTIYSLLCRARRSCLYREWFLPVNTQQSLNIMTRIQYTACYVEPGGRVYIESGSCLPTHNRV